MSLGCTDGACVWLFPNRPGMHTNDGCKCLTDIKRAVGFSKGAEIEREIHRLVKEEYFNQGPCSCCSDGSICSPGCDCWVGCEVNEDYDDMNTVGLMPPCEYHKGHSGKHLHFIGIYDGKGTISNLHGIGWGEGE